jgi:hypothetical protein
MSVPVMEGYRNLFQDDERAPVGRKEILLRIGSVAWPIADRGGCMVQL